MRYTFNNYMIMGFLQKYFNDEDGRLRKNIDAANTLFQVKEYDSELWLTYDGWLVCPCSMLKDDPVESIKRMRELYLERQR